MYIYYYILNISLNNQGKWKLYRQDYADTQQTQRYNETTID